MSETSPPPTAIGALVRFRERILAVSRSEESFALREAHVVLEDAIQAFDAGAYLSATIACRASVESAGYLFLHRKLLGPPSHFQLLWPKDPDGAFEREQFAAILAELRTRGVLTLELAKKAEVLKVHGDFVAHLASRLDEDFDNMMSGRPSRADLRTDPRSGFSPWPTPTEVLADLEAAAEIVVTITSAWIEGRGGPLGDPENLVS